MALVAVVVLGACGGGTGDEDRPATGRFGALYTAVCRAATQAGAGDLAGARRTFDDAHVGLHDLASAAGEGDRIAAGRLLEAKQRVETQLTAARLRALAGPVADAVEATGGSVPAPCP